MSAAEFLRTRARENPPFLEAVLADARAAAKWMGHEQGRTLWLILRMIWLADGYFPLVMIRLGIKLRAWGVPLLPTVCRRVAIVFGQVHIGAPVVLEPGVFLPHGQVVIDGIVHVGADCVIRPFVTIGLKEGTYEGPTIGRGTMIGTGAKVLGPIAIGQNVKVGANAVVVRDVADGATVTGVPAVDPS